MPRSKTPIISLEEAKARFDEWRQTRKGKAATPDELWSAAAEVARKEGVSRTSTELRVEWNELKRRMTTATGEPSPAASFRSGGSGALRCTLLAGNMPARISPMF